MTHAACDAAVEEDRQRHVAAGVADLAHVLDQHGADHGGGQRPRDREQVRGGRGEPGADQPADGHARQRDVPEAVAEQGEPLLHQIGADHRGGEPDEHCDDQRVAQQVGGEDVQHRDHAGWISCPRHSSSGAASSGCPCPGSRCGRSLTGPSWTMRPWSRTTARADVVGQRTGLVQDHEQGGAAGGELPEELGDQLLGGDVHPGERLVEHEQLGIAHQGPGDHHASALPAGHAGDRPAGEVRHPDRLERGVDPGVAGARPPAAGAEQAAGDGLPRGGRDRAGLGRLLGDVAEAVVGAALGDRAAQQVRRAALERQHPDRGAQQGRLARAVRAEQRDELAALDAQVDVVQDPLAGAGDARADDLDDRSVPGSVPGAHAQLSARAVQLLLMTAG